jgi:hypothetical protein
VCLLTLAAAVRVVVRHPYTNKSLCLPSPGDPPLQLEGGPQQGQHQPTPSSRAPTVAPTTIALFLKDMSGRVFSVDVGLDTTVLQLKERAAVRKQSVAMCDGRGFCSPFLIVVLCWLHRLLLCRLRLVTRPSLTTLCVSFSEVKLCKTVQQFGPSACPTKRVRAGCVALTGTSWLCMACQQGTTARSNLCFSCVCVILCVPFPSQ